MKVENGGAAVANIPADLRSQQFKPVTKRIWIDTGLSGSIGFAIFEFGPDGLRWSWEHDEAADATIISFEQIVAGTHVVHADDIQRHLRIADAQIMMAKAAVAAVEKSRAWKLVRSGGPTDHDDD